MRPVRRRGPVRGAAAARVALALPRQHVRPGDPRRHPRGPRPGRRCRPHPDRTPGEGPGVGCRRGGGGPGGHLARPADALVPARHGRANGRSRGRAGAGHRHRCHRRRPGGQAAQRGASAVLRRGHPCPPPPGGHRVGQRRQPGTAVPVPGRTGRRQHRDRGRGRGHPPLAVAARPHRRPAPGRCRLRPPARAAPGGCGAACPAGRRRGPGCPPGAVVPAHRGVRSQRDPACAGWHADAAVAVPGGEVPQVRAAVAAGDRRRGGVLRRGPALRHPHPRRRGARRHRGQRGLDQRPDRRDLAPLGLRQPLVQREGAGAGPGHGEQVPHLACGQLARPDGGRATVARASRRGGDHRAGGPAGAGPGRARHRRRPEDRVHSGARGRPGPASAARRLPARRAARGVRAVRLDRARRRRADPGGERELDRPGASAAATGTARRPGPQLGKGPGRDGGGGHGRAAVRGADEPGVPELPGPDLLHGTPRRPAGDPVSPAIRYEPGHLARLLGLPEPTTEQAEVIAAPLEPLAVIAGAGSGKSETMAARLVWLVANGMVRPERVLGLTFTRKAAAELGQRVRARLAGLRRAGLDVTGGDPAPAGLLADGPVTAGGAGAGSLTGGLLSNRAHDLGGGPAAGRLGSRAGADLASGAVLGALDGRVPADLAHGAGASGPGGGLLADPRVAAGGQAAGITAEGDLLDGEPVVSTYHSYAARLVADHALREALEPTVRLITPAVAWQMAARVVAAYAGPMDAVHWAPQATTAAVLDLAGELAEHLGNPADIYQIGDWLEMSARSLPGRMPSVVRKTLDCQRTREQLLPLVAGYVAAKAAREVIDYGDQVTLAARIATRHREVGAIERARYQVVLLDEFQDTSHAQLVLLRALFGGGHPVTAVGDPCQSIYGWRGASAGNLARFAREFPVGARPATVAQLATSFRNTGRVLDAAATIQRDLRE